MKHIEDIGYTIEQCGEILSRYHACYIDTEEVLRDYGNGDLLSRSQIHLLALIYDTPGITMSEVARIKNRKKSTISQSLAVLESKSYILRKQDEKDAKKLRLYPTEAGKALAELHKAYDLNAFSEMNRRILETCSSEELTAFYKVMSLYTDIKTELQKKT